MTGSRGARNLRAPRLPFFIYFTRLMHKIYANFAYFVIRNIVLQNRQKCAIILYTGG